jgi:hypothetical protein
MDSCFRRNDPPLHYVLRRAGKKGWNGEVAIKMGLISEGISNVRVFELPGGVWEDGRVVAGPRVCLVKWQSAWADKIHQLYAGGRFAGATIDCEQRQMVVRTPSCFDGAVRVEVFAVEQGEADIDFGEQLQQVQVENGRVRLRFLRSQRLPAGARFEVYYNKGSGEIDYEKSIGGGQIWESWQDKAGFALARFGEGDFGYEWCAGVGFGRGEFGRGEFGVDADVIEWVSSALEAGIYKFGIKVVDEQGNESAASETGEVTVIPEARPVKKASVLSLDVETNELMIGIES